MMAYKDENELIIKAVEWTLKMTEAINAAGGIAPPTIRDIPNELKIIFIRNNLYLRYGGSRD